MLVGGRNGLGQRRAAECYTEHLRARWFRGHPVIVAVVLPATVGVVTTLFCVPISTTTILVDVASCVVSSLIVGGAVEDECCLLPSRGQLVMDQHLLLVLGRLLMLLCGCSSMSRGRALGLLNCRHLEQSLHLVSNVSRLGVRWFGHIA